MFLVCMHDWQELLARLDALHKQGEKIMATLDDVVAKVTAENTVIDSAVALLQELAKAVQNLQPSQEAINNLYNEISQKTDALAAAVQANTPVPPGP
jgi:uncharacterized protein YoxC